MAGKRLLDAARLFNAARSVGKQHVVLRQEQWDVYSKTSSLAKGVKNQTDRVTVTAYAAYELAKRLNENGPSWQPSQGSGQTPEDSRKAADATREPPLKDDATTTAQAPSSTPQDLPPEFAVRHNAPGERGVDDEKASSLREREAQRISEEQAPIAKQDRQGGRDEGRTIDSYSDLTDAVPEEAAASRRREEQDSGTSARQDRGDAIEEELPDGVNLDGLFSSRRVAQGIGAEGSYTKNRYGTRKKLPAQPLPEMRKAQERFKAEQYMTSAPVEQESPPARDFASPEGDVETQKLAKSIAQEADSQSSASSSNLGTSEQSSKPYEMHESRVPSSRFGRLWQYGGLATSMAFGAVGESFRRFTGGSSEGSVMMSEANMNRLVAKLSRMRGAALKLGQMVSFQDSKMLPPTINKILQRVQDSADYMPPSQRDKVLKGNLGKDWRDLFGEFEEKPFAAASIGQVHKATLKSNGKEVAVKVQYPGVKNSIDSDLNNLALLLTASRLLPKGLFLEKTIDNARTELAWECDYEREAQACIRFKGLLESESHIFNVPEIYTEASSPEVLTAEFMVGTAVTKMNDLSQHDRDWVGTQILRLCLRELMEWQFMQTDPNWTNFLYNRESQKLELLDFGASRGFPMKFVDPYVNLLIAASKNDRQRCWDLSIELGYLTGQEGKDMVKAHVDSIMTLAEPFVENAPEVYDFEDQTITDRVRANIGLMLQERLAPPPEETYSLHRKLSGAFLLCARLKSKVRAREMFADAVEVWNGRKGGVGDVPVGGKS